MKRHDNNPVSPVCLALADNSYRRKEFRTRTVLTDKSGRKVVCKFASSEEAVDFLKAIIVREKANAEYLKEHFDVLCGEFKGDHIEYEYLPYPSLNEGIASAFRENRCGEADNLLEVYVRKLRALNISYAWPGEFLSMVSQDGATNRHAEIECLSRGVLDLTPRNILVDASRCVVVDNEWSFDFPVPVAFVLFRAIREIVKGLQGEIRRCTTRARPAVGIVVRNLRTCYFPEGWIKYITDSQLSLAEMLRWEMGFQRYTTGVSGGTVGRVKTNPRIKTHFSMWRLGNEYGITGTARRVLRKAPLVPRLVRFVEDRRLHSQK
ncbi:MAG: hypothetical protein JSU70_23390 [Phycisphaerales bacterium]|nr:MAG: hypothetical protein JSU70_23390 [Phycisphaerales bacterium]